MERSLRTLLEELKWISRTMAVYDSMEGRAEEDDVWVRSLADGEVERIFDWLACDPTTLGLAPESPESWCLKLRWKGLRLCGAAARLRSEPILSERLASMFLEPKGMDFARDFVCEWRSEAALPMLRRVAETADAERVNRLSECLVEIKHPDAAALLQEMAARRKDDPSLQWTLQSALEFQALARTTMPWESHE